MSDARERFERILRKGGLELAVRDYLRAYEERGGLPPIVPPLTTAEVIVIAAWRDGRTMPPASLRELDPPLFQVGAAGGVEPDWWMLTGLGEIYQTWVKRKLREAEARASSSV